MNYFTPALPKVLDCIIPLNETRLLIPSYQTELNDVFINHYFLLNLFYGLGSMIIGFQFHLAYSIIIISSQHFSALTSFTGLVLNKTKYVLH